MKPKTKHDVVLFVCAVFVLGVEQPTSLKKSKVSNCELLAVCYFATLIH